MDNVTNIIEAITPTVDQMVADYAALALEKGWPFTCRDREDYRLDAMVDLLKVVGRYFLPTDIIEVRGSEGRKHKVEAWFKITRDGVKYGLHTYTINVRGLSQNKDGSWRAEHYRYAVDTDLLKHDSNPAMAEVIRQRNRKRKYDRITDAIQQERDFCARDVSAIEAKMAMSDDQIISAAKLDIYTWEAMPEGGKANFDYSEEAFNKRIAQDKADQIENHRRVYSCARIAAIQKEAGKRIAKMEAKSL